MSDTTENETPKPKSTPKKRTSVPKVEKPPVVETAVDAIAEKAAPIVTPVNNPKENSMHKIKALVVNNQQTIKRKLIVAVGTGIGMLIASTVIDNLGQRKPDVVLVEVDPETLIVAEDTPAS